MTNIAEAKPSAIFVMRLSSKAVSKLAVVNHKTKEEVPCDGHSMNESC